MKTSAICILAVALASAGCSYRYAILTVPAVSMTDPSFEGGYKGTSGGKVEAEYCRGDKTLASHDENVGLIDEAVLKAQQGAGAKYLKDVTISRDGSCIWVEGTAMR
jgi:hypothetical protein